MSKILVVSVVYCCLVVYLCYCSLESETNCDYTPSVLWCSPKTERTKALYLKICDEKGSFNNSTSRQERSLSCSQCRSVEERRVPECLSACYLIFRHGIHTNLVLTNQWRREIQDNLIFCQDKRLLQRMGRKIFETKLLSGHEHESHIFGATKKFE